MSICDPTGLRDHAEVDKPLSAYLPEQYRGEITESLSEIIEGVGHHDERSLHRFHQLLNRLNRQRFSIHGCATLEEEQRLNSLCKRLESIWLAHEKSAVEEMLSDVPGEPEVFPDWFQDLAETGPGQGHSLFLYLGERASFEEFEYFFQQELSSESGFDDLVAMTQVKTPSRVKMELAHNYWDEMGRGSMAGVHSHLFDGILNTFDINSVEAQAKTHWAPLALSNNMLAFASNRSLFGQSIGSLGVIELTAPGRCEYVVQGLKRLGLLPKQYIYYAVHATLDKEHWRRWKKDVITPLVEEYPGMMTSIAEGALIRLLAGFRCFDAYSRHLGLEASLSAHHVDMGALGQV